MTADFSQRAHEDVLAKMDALLKRHHDRLEKAPPASPAMDFPVLTEVVTVEEEVIPLLTEVVELPVVVEEKAEMDEFPFLLLEDEHEQQTLELSGEEPASAELSSQLLENLHAQIQEILDQRLPVHIASAIEQAMSGILDQFSSQMESVVRVAVAQELQKQLGEIARRTSNASD
ncbi:MAG: hypothetical protein K8H84_06400 [Sulfuricella denitrificans]|nr:hypothetical protein [Sulfuricella denitrificans]